MKATYALTFIAVLLLASGANGALEWYADFESYDTSSGPVAWSQSFDGSS